MGNTTETFASNQKQLLEEIIRVLPFDAAVFDCAMRYLAYNSGWLLTHGASSDQAILGKCHYDTFPQIRDEWRQIHARCLAGATERNELDYFDQADGTRVYIRWVVSPWHNENNQVGGIVIYSENITTQVTMSRQLEENQNMMRDMFEKSPIGFNVCHMDGVWLGSNPAFIEMLGYSRAEADSGMTYWQLTPSKYDAEEAARLAELHSIGRYGPYEKEFIRKDGSLIPVRLNGFMIKRGGEDLIWSFIEDITAQRTLEAKVEDARLTAIQTSKLATMGEMAASFAHEISSPLTVIGTFTDILDEAIQNDDKADIEESINAIRISSERAIKILKGLQKFARETMSEPFEEIPVANVIDDTMTLCHRRFVTNGVALTVGPVNGARVRGRSVELSQVLLNLLNNAFDAARNSEGKWIRLTTDEATSAKEILIVVEDSGLGIPAVTAAEMFRSFFTTKKAGEGTGLGLSISRNIIERHGGTLTYDASAPNTRFIVRLPRLDDSHG